MTEVTEIWVNRGDYRETRIVNSEQQELAEGEVLVAIDKFALTSNNVTYAVAGERIGYWNFYPAEDNWGKVTVWGLADVIESMHPGIAVGERLYGFYPMASHAVLRPGRVADDFFMDSSAHRLELAAVYNQYRRLKGEPEQMRQLEDERCLYFPLFITSYVLCDYLTDNDFFGAQQIIIGSVSSKTGLGLAKMLARSAAASPKIIGLTSSSNLDFVINLGCCDEVVAYDNVDQINLDLRTAWVDMSGNGELTATLHQRAGDNMVESCMVGATHWEAGRSEVELPGATPKFFFAPSQIAKRDKEWGPGVLYGKAALESAAVANEIKDIIAIEQLSGAEVVDKIWKDLVNYKVDPSRGIMVSLKNQ